MCPKLPVMIQPVCNSTYYFMMGRIKNIKKVNMKNILMRYMCNE